jgi:hypothetical protein
MFRIAADGIYRGSVTANRQLDFLGTDFDTLVWRWWILCQKKLRLDIYII